MTMTERLSLVENLFVLVLTSFFKSMPLHFTLPFPDLITVILCHFGIDPPEENNEELSKTIDQTYLLHYFPLKVDENGLLVLPSEQEVVEEQDKPPSEPTNTLKDASLSNLNVRLEDVNKTLVLLLKSSNRIGNLIESFAKSPCVSKSLVKL